MRRVKLTQGKFALVDDEDFDYLNQWKWCFHKHQSPVDGGYAVRGESKKLIRMHRDIMKPQKGVVIDHINMCGLDNRRSNLRLATKNQNLQHSKKRVGVSQYKGVCQHKTDKKWVARIQVNGKRIHLLRTNDEIKAARAYDTAAIKYFGEFAVLNNV